MITWLVERWRVHRVDAAHAHGRTVCDCCDEIAPKIGWDRLRGRGWIYTTWPHGEASHAWLCPDCNQQDAEGPQW